VATHKTPEETMAFYHLLTDSVEISHGLPGRLNLDGNGITAVSTFVQVYLGK